MLYQVTRLDLTFQVSIHPPCPELRPFFLTHSLLPGTQVRDTELVREKAMTSEVD